MSALNILGLAMAQVGTAGTDLDVAHEALVDQALAREAAIHGVDIEHVAVIVIGTDEVMRVDHVVASLQPYQEKWVRRQLQPQGGSSEIPTDPSDWWEDASTSLITGVDIWDGSRALGVRRSASTGKWTGSLRNSFDSGIRSGPLRVGILPGEKWLSERLSNWTLVAVFEDSEARRYLYTNANDSRIDLHRIETWHAWGSAISRYMITSGALDAVDVDACTGESFFEPTTGETLLVDDRVLDVVLLNGLYLPSRVRTSQSFTATSTAAEIRYNERDPGLLELDAKALPSEVASGWALIWDELLQEAFFLGDPPADEIAWLERSNMDQGLAGADLDSARPPGAEEAKGRSWWLLAVSGVFLFAALRGLGRRRDA